MQNYNICEHVLCLQIIEDLEFRPSWDRFEVDYEYVAGPHLLKTTKTAFFWYIRASVAGINENINRTFFSNLKKS